MTIHIMTFLEKKMNDKEKILINKFLDKHCNDLEVINLLHSTYITLGRKKDSQKLFLYHSKSGNLFTNNDRVLNPIVKMFNTDYVETQEYIKNWVFENYNIKSKKLIGIDPYVKTI